MPEIDRLAGVCDRIELDFVEKEETPEPLMRLSIQLHAAGLSLSDTVSVLDEFGVDRARSTVHNWVQKADLQPEDGKNPDHVAVDETVIQLDDQQYWLYAAVDPATSEFLHLRLFPARTTALTQTFLAELCEKHHAEDAVFLVDRGPWLHAACHRLGLDFRHETHGDRNAVERVFREVKRRTKQFSNTFAHVDPDTAETWLQTLARRHNALN